MSTTTETKTITTEWAPESTPKRRQFAVRTFLTLTYPGVEWTIDGATVTMTGPAPLIDDLADCLGM